MINSIPQFVRALALLCVLALTSSASAEDDIAALMQERLQTLLSIISADHTEANLDSTLRAMVDYPAITRGVLGKHKESLTSAQIKRFQGEFEQSMKNLLVSALSSLGDFDLVIGEVKKRNENRAQVFAVVTTDKSERFEIVSSIGRDAEEWLVRNLIVNGVNLGLTYRNQFSELIRTQGDAVKAIDAWAETIDDAVSG